MRLSVSRNVEKIHFKMLKGKGNESHLQQLFTTHQLVVRQLIDSTFQINEKKNRIFIMQPFHHMEITLIYVSFHVCFPA